MSAHVIIPAAGLGVRFGGASKKQFLRLKDKTVLEHIVNTAVTLAFVKSVIVVLPADEIPWTSSCAKLEKIIVTAGGASRAQSVFCGFQKIAAASSADIVLIHDAARALASPELFERVYLAAQQRGAAIPVIRVTDTIKRVCENGDIHATLDRTNLVRAQTPQGFHYGWLKNAYACCDIKDPSFTDESLLVEKTGKIVASVAGDEANIKITTPFDFLLARALLEDPR